MEEYDSPIWDVPKFLYPNPDFALSTALKNNDYNYFMKIFESKVRDTGRVDVDYITATCEGQCPKGCSKKFKLKLGKSLTKKSFEKIFLHCNKYPDHCINTKYTGVIKHGDVL
jgi:hypothetical protein